MSKFIARWLGMLFGAVLWASGLGSAFAFDQGSATVTLEGCRNDGSVVLPNPNFPGKYICDDPRYTTGNLFPWAELDLVPHRLTTTVGSQSSEITDYNVYIAGDGILNGKAGWDVISVPVVNSAKSDASCTVSPVGGQLTLGDNTSPFGGGVDTVIYRQLAIHQNKGTTCVFDYYQRLALGAHLYSGSSLQSYTFDQVGLTGGKKTLSLPVKESLPQTLRKDMSAAGDSTAQWSLEKAASPASINFGNVCTATSNDLQKTVTFTVKWVKGATVAGGVTFTTHVYAKNPAARAITVNVTDKVYKDLTQTTLLDTASASANVPANTELLVLTHTKTITDGSAGGVGDSLNDVATATYTDTVTSIPIPQFTTASFSTTIQTGNLFDSFAAIADSESMTGTGLTFKVATPLVGLFDGYIAGTPTTGPVNWGITGQTASGSVDFVKTIVLDAKRITSGKIYDSASLVAVDTLADSVAAPPFDVTVGPIEVGITSTATVSLTVRKSIPVKLKDGEKIVVNFTVAPTAGGAGVPVTVTFTGPSAIGATADSLPLSLDPASYTVTEGASTYYATSSSAGVPLILVPDQASKVLNLSPKAGGIMDSSNCSGTVSFVNSLPDGSLPKAKVAKITLPTLLATDSDYAWKFTLTGPAGFVAEDVTANAGQPSVPFTQSLSIPGTYTVTETTKTGWDFTKVILPDATTWTTNACTFVVTLTVADVGRVFECTFTNTKRGYVKVVKTLKGQPLTNQQFTFQLRTGATSNADGALVETLTTNVAPSGSTLNFTTQLVPGSHYQICEATQAGWMTSFNDPTNPLFVPGAFLPPGTTIPNVGVDNSWLCVDFTVAPGVTKTFNIDNSPPPGGRGLTIGYWKTHASCTTSSTSKDPALDKQLKASSGILKSSKIDSLVFADHTTFGLYGQNATGTADCPYAVSLLDKRNFGGTKMASDPLFNMVAQLIAAELNLAAGAYTCPAVANAVTSAEGLLATKGFTGVGTGYAIPKLTTTQASLANTLATKLDDYNNNRAGVCP